MERVARRLLQVEIDRIVAEAASRGSPLTPYPSRSVCLPPTPEQITQSIILPSYSPQGRRMRPCTPDLRRPRKSPKVRLAVSQIDWHSVAHREAPGNQRLTSGPAHFLRSIRLRQVMKPLTGSQTAEIAAFAEAYAVERFRSNDCAHSHTELPTRPTRSAMG